MNVWGYLGVGILLVSGFIIILAVLYNVGMIWLAGKYSGKTIEKQIDIMEKELPGTNCGACGCAGCADYAKSIVEDGNAVNKCTPGGAACAAAIAAVLNGFCPIGQDITVKVRGGELFVRYTGETVYMTGAAKLVYAGEIEI